LLLISEVEETEIFKICLEYWNSLASELYHECPFLPSAPLLLGLQSSRETQRKIFYAGILSKVCRVA
jgi:exportin-1